MKSIIKLRNYYKYADTEKKEYDIADLYKYEESNFSINKVLRNIWRV